MKNKRLHSNKPKSEVPSQTASEKGSAEQQKLTASQLQEKVYLLEVELTAASRIERERYLRNLNTVPPPEIVRKPLKSGKARLTHGQLQARKRHQMLLLGEFIFGVILLAGAIAWVLKAWEAWTH